MQVTNVAKKPGFSNRIARRAVQIGFLLLFLYPLVPIIYRKLTSQPAPAFDSWLLRWDPLLLLGAVLRQNWAVAALLTPLLLIVLSIFLGRFFCGWVCPVGTTLDLVRPVTFWRGGKGKSEKRKTQDLPTVSPQIGIERSGGLPAKASNPARSREKKTKGRSRLFPINLNSPLRYYLLVAALAGGVLSLQALGLLDPLVIFHRASTAIVTDLFALQQPALRAFFSFVSLIFLGILALELWQPRFWCRNLCPLGALISAFSRFSLLNRRVGETCTSCADCRRACPMNAIPLKEPHNTDYADCTFCLECEAACPNGGVTFGFGALAGKIWQRSRGAEERRSRGAEEQRDWGAWRISESTNQRISESANQRINEWAKRRMRPPHSHTPAPPHPHSSIPPLISAGNTWRRRAFWASRSRGANSSAGWRRGRRGWRSCRSLGWIVAAR
jgi:polyferredoxin